MRTGRSLTVYLSLLPGIGGGPAAGGGGGGCLLRRASAVGGGVSAVGRCLLQRQPPPCGQNHRRLYKHYLGPTSLHPVKMLSLSKEKKR